MKRIPSTWTDWHPGKTQYSAGASKPGNALDFILPAGTKFASVHLFIPQQYKAGAAARIGKWPECSYALNLTTGEYIALPWQDHASLTVPMLESRDCQVQKQGGIITILEKPIGPLALARRLFVRFLPYDRRSYIFEARIMVQVDPDIYSAWFNMGRPLPANGGPSGLCDPIWAEGSGDDPDPEPPEPEHECNPFMAAICAMKGLDCYDNECVEDDDDGDAPSLVVAVKQPLELEALEYDDLDIVEVNGLMPGPATLVFGFLAPDNRAFVVSSEGEAIRACPGDAISMVHFDVPDDILWTEVFAGHEKPGRKYVIGVEQGGVWKWAAWRKA